MFLLPHFLNTYTVVSSFKYCYLSNYEIMMNSPVVSYLIKAGIFKK